MSVLARQLLRVARELLASSRTFRTDGSSQQYPNLTDDIRFSEYEAGFRLDPSVALSIKNGMDTIESVVERLRKQIGSEYIIEGRFFRSSGAKHVSKTSRQRLHDFGKAWALNESSYNLRSGFTYPKSMSRVTFRLSDVKEDRGLITLSTDIEMEVTPFADREPVKPKSSVGVKGDELVIPLDEAKVKRETDKAILVAVRSREVWLPKSKVRQTASEIGVPLWLARRVPEFAEYLH